MALNALSHNLFHNVSMIERESHRSKPHRLTPLKSLGHSMAGLLPRSQFTCKPRIPIFPSTAASYALPQNSQANLAQPHNVHVRTHVPVHISCDTFRYQYHCYCVPENPEPPRFTSYESPHVTTRTTTMAYRKIRNFVGS
jgi:hypothetical protein